VGAVKIYTKINDKSFCKSQWRQGFILHVFVIGSWQLNGSWSS